jgi:hypothetical protein
MDYLSLYQSLKIKIDDIFCSLQRTSSVFDDIFSYCVTLPIVDKVSYVYSDCKQCDTALYDFSCSFYGFNSYCTNSPTGQFSYDFKSFGMNLFAIKYPVCEFKLSSCTSSVKICAFCGFKMYDMDSPVIEFVDDIHKFAGNMIQKKKYVSRNNTSKSINLWLYFASILR